MKKYTCFISLSGSNNVSKSTNDICEAWALYREAIAQYPNGIIYLIDNRYNETFASTLDE